MREAERDAALRERVGAMLGAYRRLIVGVARADQSVAQRSPGRPPAAGGWLLLHPLLDPVPDAQETAGSD